MNLVSSVETSTAVARKLASQRTRGVADPLLTRGPILPRALNVIPELIFLCPTVLGIELQSPTKAGKYLLKLRLSQGIIIGVVIGIAVGVGAYTFVYARGYSYLTDKPEACANCHVMQDQYSGWLKSSHRMVAVCNDCHTPPAVVGKYTTKARNGFWHSYYFTTGWFEDNIRITPRGQEVTEQTCRKCHDEIVNAIEGVHPEVADARTSCIRCHNSVGHMH